MIIVRIVGAVPVSIRRPGVPVIMIINIAVPVAIIIPFVEVTPAITVTNLHAQVAIVIIVVHAFITLFLFRNYILIFRTGG